MNKEYSKLQGGAGHHGGLYQIKLLLMLLLKAYQRNKQFRLSTEDKAGEKFDDIILQEEDEAILVQVKHRTSSKKRITFSELLSENSDFSLPKYLDSYLTTTKNSNFSSQASYVICTNVDVEAKIFESDYAESISINDENIFYNPLKEIQPILYSFNKTKTNQELKACRQNISEENITNFLKSLQLIIISDDSTEDDIKGILKGLSILHKEINIDFIYYIMLEHITNWFSSKKAYYLRKHHLETYCSEINSSVFIEKIIQQYEDVISSINIELPSDDPQVVMIKTSRYLILMAKLYQQLQTQQKNKILLVNPDLKFYLIMMNAFQLHLNFTHLICRIPSRNKKNIISNLENVLRNMSDKNYKKVIILTEDVITLNCPQQVHVISDDVFYKDICLSHLYRKKYDRNTPFYIARGFIKCSKSKTLYSEKYFITYIFNNQKKTFLISGIAGMGKSTVLSNLANAINTEFKNFFALNINLNKCVPLFHKLIKNKRQLQLNDLINFELKIDKFQQQLLSIPNTIFLMLDGLDELSKNQQTLVLKFIKSNIKSSNLYKIIISTRPPIEIKLHFETLTLEPLDVNQQANYIANFWVKSLNVKDEENIKKYESYSLKVLNKLSSVINEVKTLLGTPLMVKIIAEIFKPYAKKYCKNSNEDLQDNMYINWNILDMYKIFIERKKEIYVQEKGDAQGNEKRIRSLSNDFEKLLQDCQALATTIVFGAEDVQEIFEMDPFIGTNLLCETGLVTLSDGNFQFLHRTFAEYFFAQQLFHEIVNCNLKRIECFIFLFPWLPYTTNFLNSILKTELNKLKPNCFDICADLTNSLFQEQSKLINDHILKLTTDNCMHIIRLFLDRCDVTGHLKVWPEIFRTAADNCNYEMLQYFIEKGLDLSVVVEKGDPVLYNVVKTGNLKLVRYLAEAGADLHLKNHLGETALYSACEINNFDMAKFLVESGVDFNTTNTSGNTVLHNVVKNGNIELFRYLVKAGADLHSKNQLGETVLYSVCEINNLDMAKLVVESGVDFNSIDTSGNTVLHDAVKHGNLELVNYLVGAGADLHSKNHLGETVLHSTCEINNLDMAKFVVESGVDFKARDTSGNTVLHKAILNSNLELIKFLVKQGADLHYTNIAEETLLHIAHQKNNLNIAIYLIKNGIDLNAKDKFGNTALHKAVEVDNSELVTYLVDAGADLHIKNKKEKTILYIACENDHFSLIRYLIRKGLDINTKDRFGNSLLHVAVENNNFHLVTYLEATEVNLKSKNVFGETILQIAYERGYFRIVEFLVEQGLDIYSVPSKYLNLHKGMAQYFARMEDELVERIRMRQYFRTHNSEEED